MNIKGGLFGGKAMGRLRTKEESDWRLNMIKVLYMHARK
jgi:hypothetical protein